MQKKIIIILVLGSEFSQLVSPFGFVSHIILSTLLTVRDDSKPVLFFLLAQCLKMPQASFVLVLNNSEVRLIGN